jgi:hypothetical protein
MILLWVHSNTEEIIVLFLTRRIDGILVNNIEKVPATMICYHLVIIGTRYGGALHKAWIGYCIAINKWEFDKEIKYARLIRKFQRDLGLELSDFKCLH